MSINVLPKQDTIWSILSEAVTAGATGKNYDAAFVDLKDQGYVGSLSIMCLRLVQTNAILSFHRATSLTPRGGFGNGCSTSITGFSLVIR
jgi:hypothetical protein